MKNVIAIRTDVDNMRVRMDEFGENTTYDYVTSVVKKLKERLECDATLVSLTAPQINENIRIFVIKTAGKGNDKYKAILNPLIIKSSKEIHLSREQNPSFPNKVFIIPRHDEVTVAYQNPDGTADVATFKGAYAEEVAQAIQTLDGVLLDTYALDLDDVGGADVFDTASDEDKTAVLTMYLEHLKSLKDKLFTEISNDSELSSMNKFIDVTEARQLADVEFKDTDGNVLEKPTEEDLFLRALNKHKELKKSKKK